MEAERAQKAPIGREEIDARRLHPAMMPLLVPQAQGMAKGAAAGAEIALSMEADHAGAIIGVDEVQPGLFGIGQFLGAIPEHRLEERRVVRAAGHQIGIEKAERAAIDDQVEALFALMQTFFEGFARGDVPMKAEHPDPGAFGIAKLEAGALDPTVGSVAMPQPERT